MVAHSTLSTWGEGTLASCCFLSIWGGGAQIMQDCLVERAGRQNPGPTGWQLILDAHGRVRRARAAVDSFLELPQDSSISRTQTEVWFTSWVVLPSVAQQEDEGDKKSHADGGGDPCWGAIGSWGLLRKVDRLRMWLLAGCPHSGEWPHTHVYAVSWTQEATATIKKTLSQ